MMPAIDVDSAADRLGHTILGPAFLAFAHLLLRHATQTGCKRLGFLARDGDLLLRVVENLPQTHVTINRPLTTYLHLSRRSTMLPARPQIDAATLIAADKVRTGARSWRRRLNYLGLPTEALSATFARLGLDPDRANPPDEETAVLLATADFLAFAAQQRSHQRRLLERYLAQSGVGSNSGYLLVDIGWRGSILRNIESAFGSEDGFSTPRAAFLGMWSESATHTEFPDGCIGLISDCRRRRTLTEGAAWYAAFLLEAICRGDESAVVGYDDVDGTVVPRLADETPARAAERTGSRLATRIRRGILDYVATHGEDPFWITGTDAQLRTRAQRLLRRLAFFPTPGEIAIGSHLVHTESHDPEWFSPLIAVARPCPVRTPRQWLTGLASPWRAGYVAATGGLPMSLAWLGLETFMLRMPGGLRESIANLARRQAGLPLIPGAS